ncbi:MAG: enoyl-CoA hydratase-related protein [Clostridia bacterium]|nr:enoyl-CoA hydratase-related protein [Clostridia bacterium]
MGQKIMTRGPVAVAKAKQAIDQGLQMTLREGQDLEAKLFGQLCATGDKNEGARAFLEKRPARFKGR